MAKEFVARRGVISLGGLTFPYYPTSVSYTASTDDFFIDITNSGVEVQLPNAIGIEGKQYAIRNTSTGNTTVSCFSTQTIEGVTGTTLGKGNTIQVVSDNIQWKISNVGGPIRTATNNSLLTSDGTIGGVNANTGLTFNGQTLKIEGQTSATTAVETYAYTLEGPFTVTGTGYVPENVVFSIPNENYIRLEVTVRLVLSGDETNNSFINYGKSGSVTTGTNLSSTPLSNSVSTRLNISSNTNNTIGILRHGSFNKTEVVSEVYISTNIVKYN
jgi:hypothetical protein